MRSGGNSPSQLQIAYLEITNRVTCAAQYAIFGGLPSNSICAGVAEGGIDSCQVIIIIGGNDLGENQSLIGGGGSSPAARYDDDNINGSLFYLPEIGRLGRPASLQ